MIPPVAHKIAAGALGTGVGVAAVSALTEDHIGAAQLLIGSAAALIAATWGVLLAFDGRMDSKVRASEKRVVAQIHHLRDLLIEKGIIHSHPPAHDEDRDT